MATGDLNEYKIHELIAAQAPIDAFGVGTDLATSSDAPSLGMVYKMVEMDEDGRRRFTIKLSAEKSTLAGAKQVFRYHDHDVVARSFECAPASAEALLQPVMIRGELLEPLPNASAIRAHATEALNRLPASCHSLFEAQPWRVELSPELETLNEKVREGVAA
mgnify:FL=1